MKMSEGNFGEEAFRKNETNESLPILNIHFVDYYYKRDYVKCF